MNQIPFLAFPSSEQDALLRALRRAGVSPRGICVSRFELAVQARGEGAFTTISTAGWVRPYAAAAGDWIRSLERELANLTRKRSTAGAQRRKTAVPSPRRCAPQRGSDELLLT